MTYDQELGAVAEAPDEIHFTSFQGEIEIFIKGRIIKEMLVLAISFGVAGNALAVPYILSNGPGDGTVTVGVDGFGSFGSSIGSDASNAVYDPIGGIGSAGTSFESGIAIRFGSSGRRTFLTSGDIGGTGLLSNPGISGSDTSASSSFGSPAGCSDLLYSSDRQGFVIMMDKIPDRSNMIFDFF